MKDRVSNLSCKCINRKEVEVRIEVGLGQIMIIKVIKDITKTLEVEQGIVPSNRGSYGYNMRGNQRYGRNNNNNNNRRGNYMNQSYNRNRRRSYERQSRNRRNNRSINNRSRSGSRTSTNRDRIKCFECMEYDHFA